MQLYFLVGIGWSRDASGNLQATDSAGNILAKFIGGVFSGKLNIVQINNNSGASISQTSPGLSTGIGVVITPQVSGRVLVLFSGGAFNNTATDGGNFGLYRHTGSSVPASGTGLGTDLQITGSQGVQFTQGSANETYPVTISGVDIAAVNGTTYAYYLAFSTVGGGTLTVNSNGTTYAIEL